MKYLVGLLFGCIPCLLIAQQDSVGQLKADLVAQEVYINKLQTAIKQAKTAINELEGDLEKLELQHLQLLEQNKVLEAQATDKDKNIQYLETKLRAKEKGVSCKEQTQALREELEQLYQIKKRLHDKVNLLGNQNESLQKKLQQKEKQRLLLQRIRNTNLANNIAEYSLRIDDSKKQALLAKEAYELHTACSNNPYNPKIYRAVYQALFRLESELKENHFFNRQQRSTVTKVGKLRALAVSNDSRFVYSYGSDGNLLKWKYGIYKNKAAKQAFANQAEVLLKNNSVGRTLSLSSDNHFLAIGGDDATITIYDLRKGTITHQLKLRRQKSVLDLIITPDNKGVIYLSEDRKGTSTVGWYNFDKSKVIIDEQTIPFRINTIDLSSDNKYIVITGDSAEFYVWDIQATKKTFTLKNSLDFSPITTVAIHPRGRFIASGHKNGLIHIWDLQKVQQVENYSPHRLNAHQARISDLEFSPDGRFLGAGSLDKTASLWFFRNSDYRGVDNVLEFPFSKPTYRPIQLDQHQSWVTSVTFSPNSYAFITGTADGELFFWEVDATVYADQICTLLQRNLDDKTWLDYIGTDAPKEAEIYIQLQDNKRYPHATCGKQYPPLKE